MKTTTERLARCLHQAATLLKELQSESSRREYPELGEKPFQDALRSQEPMRPRHAVVLGKEDLDRLFNKSKPKPIKDFRGRYRPSDVKI